MRVVWGVILSLLLLLASACSDDLPGYVDEEAQLQEDVLIIQDYIRDNEFSNVFDLDGTGVYLSYIEKIDTSIHPDSMYLWYPNGDDRIKVAYTGYLTDGTVFDQTAEGEFAYFYLNQLITGWQIGLSYMKVGERALIMIPSYYGYGPLPKPGIPGNSVLIFDVYLDYFEEND